MTKIQKQIAWVFETGRFGRLKPVKLTGISGTNPRFSMVCDCGGRAERSLATLKIETEGYHHCGCLNEPKPARDPIKTSQWQKTRRQVSEILDRARDRQIVMDQTGEVWE